MSCGNDGFRSSLIDPEMAAPTASQAALQLNLYDVTGNRPPPGPEYAGRGFYDQTLGVLYQCLFISGVWGWVVVGASATAGGGTAGFSGTVAFPTSLTFVNGLCTVAVGN